MSQVLVLITVLLVLFAWRTGRLGDFGNAALGKLTLVGRAT